MFYISKQVGCKSLQFLENMQERGTFLKKFVPSKFNLLRKFFSWYKSFNHLISTSYLDGTRRFSLFPNSLRVLIFIHWPPASLRFRLFLIFYCARWTHSYFSNLRYLLINPIVLLTVWKNESL